MQAVEMKHPLVTFAATAFIVLLPGGCAQMSMPQVPDGPLVAVLPFEAAGIKDGRDEFAAQFARELAAQQADSAPSRWLHHVDGVSSAGAPAVVVPQSLRVLVIPGMFGDCFDVQSLPFSDGAIRQPPANYTQGYEIYRQSLGSVRALQVNGRASSASNAVRIAAALHAEAQRADVASIVLVAYSKGVPDTLMALDALQGDGGSLAKVRALVSVSGVVLGTPVADRYEGLYDALGAAFTPFGCSPSAGGEVASLTVRERLPALARQRLPRHLKLYSVVAYTGRSEVGAALQPFYDQLAVLDAINDGQLIAGWSVLPGSKLLAEVKSDHWTYVLPLARHPNLLIRSMAAPVEFPREAFFRALVKVVALDLQP